MTTVTSLPCPSCGSTEEIEVDEAGLLAWQIGKLIQDALPNLTASQRERLQTGYCDPCWERIMGEPDEDDENEDDFGLGSIQDLIDSGNAWRLEGHIGRQCVAAIENGAAILGPRPVRDYYGNLVPAWWMVEAGTKGSPEFADQDRPEEPSQEEKRRLCADVRVEWK